MGFRRHRTVHCFRDLGQPRADDLLLYVHHRAHGGCVSCRCHPQEAAAALPESYGCGSSSSLDRSGYQCFQSVSHMAVLAGIDARKERTGEEELGKPDRQRPRTRLHNPVELRHRRDVDTAYPQHKGRSIGAHEPKQHSAEERRPDVWLHLSADRTVLGRATGHERPRICRCLRHAAVRSGTVHRQRTDEVGAPCSDHSVDYALVGTQLHAPYRLLHRPYAHVCQVQDSGIDTRYSRVHHPSACHARPETHR